MSDKYKNYSREDLIAEIENLKRRKKFGLVWEVSPEDEIERLKKEAPFLIEDKDKAVINDIDKPTNLLIEGDNYHALSMLNYTHKGKIDVIYIDPPYNTGARDWKYNNDYVDAEDSFRHSKWINMMYERLKLAKNLLSENGIICVTIDDIEASRLKMILEDIFGESNHLGTICIRSNPAGRSTLKSISITHEYAMIFGKSNLAEVHRLPRNQKQLDRYNLKDSEGNFEYVNFRKDGTKDQFPKMYYPIFRSENSLRLPGLKWNDSEKSWELLEKPGANEIIMLPIDKNGNHKRWRWGLERVKKEINDLFILKDKSNIYIKSRIKNEGVLPITWWEDKKYSATYYGTGILKEIVGMNKFPYPKSLDAVKDSIKMMSNKKDAIILDFFAGSGTTGHAVLEMNKQDGGNRKFILCTNNENNIAVDVTYERMKKVIRGYTGLVNKQKYKALGGNLNYFRIDFMSFQNTDAHIKRYSNHFAELIKIKEETYETYSKKDGIEIYENKNKYVIIIFDEMEIKEAKKILKELDKDVVIYIYSLTDDDFGDDFEDITERIPVISFPVSLLK